MKRRSLGLIASSTDYPANPTNPIENSIAFASAAGFLNPESPTYACPA